MSNIRTLILTLATTFVGTDAGAASADPFHGRLPNILLISADNLGYGDLGSYGNQQVLTPNLDQLAREGVRFADFYAASPTCSVSRATLMTGRFPQRIQLNRQLSGPGPNGSDGIGLRHYERLIPGFLKEAGYATGCFGKWNIGFAPGSRPTDRGFDEFIGNVSGYIDYYTYRYRGKYDLFRGTEEYYTEEYSTNLYASGAIDFIQRNAARPFFVYLPFNAVHFPTPANTPETPPEERVIWQPTPESLAKYGLKPDEADPKKRYFATITALDDAVGRVLAAVDDLGLRKNTFVIFLSDNGAFMLPEKGLEVASNGPFRGGGVTLWEGGIRVPGIMRWPGRLPEGQVCAVPTTQMDILPTLLAIAGLSLPADRVLDGINILPYVAREKDLPARVLFWEYPYHGKTMTAVRFGQYKLHRGDVGEPWALYDLINDPGESRNLAESKGVLVSELVGMYELWLERATE